MTDLIPDITAVSLFDGIGGFPRALSLAGIRTVALIEIDKAAAGVAGDHFPEAKQFDDIRKVTGADLLAAGFDPRRGLITAGFPCQDLSLAGRRMGLDGARSGLYFEIMRILDELLALTGVRCRWVVLENVPGLLSSVCPCPGDGACGSGCTDPHPVRGGACGPGKCIEIHGGAMGAVLGELAERGYGFAYRVLDAQHFGVPQRRRRVVVVANSGDWAAPAEVLLEPARGGGDPAPGGAAGPRAAALAAGGTGVGGAISTLQGGGRRGFRVDSESAAGGQLIAGSLLGRSGKGPSSDLPDGHVVPVGFDAAQITSGENRSNPQPGDPQPTLAGTGVASVAYALRRDPGQPRQGHNTNHIIEDRPVWAQQGSKVGPAGSQRTGGNHTNGVPFTTYESDPSAVSAWATDPISAEGSDASEDRTRRGTPVIAFGHTNGLDPQASTEVTPTLRAGHDVGGGSVAAAAQVRRLTPVECERLQGYPDGWTATSNDRPQADSARYRQLGNSIAVPVFVWVALGIADYERAHSASTERK